MPRPLLPEVRPSAADFGATRGLDFLPDGLPIRGVAGDQQAALFGQCAFRPGEAKCTYGTGAFFLQHLGDQPTLSRHRLLTTLAASGRRSGRNTPWKAASSSPARRCSGCATACSCSPERAGGRGAGGAVAIRISRCFFVPGFVGLGAPHWVPEARGVLFGLTRGTTAADLGRATLEGVAFQVADLIDAADAGRGHSRSAALRVDGGMARNAWFLQCQADVLGLPVLQAAQSEATALGAAFLAGLRGRSVAGPGGAAGLGREARRSEPRWRRTNVVGGWSNGGERCER